MRVEGDDPEGVHCSRLEVPDEEGGLGQLHNGLPRWRAQILLLNLRCRRAIEATDATAWIGK